MCLITIFPKALLGMQTMVWPNDCNLAQGRHVEQGPCGKARCELASAARSLGFWTTLNLGSKLLWVWSRILGGTEVRPLGHTVDPCSKAQMGFDIMGPYSYQQVLVQEWQHCIMIKILDPLDLGAFLYKIYSSFFFSFTLKNFPFVCWNFIDDINNFSCKNANIAFQLKFSTS